MRHLPAFADLSRSLSRPSRSRGQMLATLGLVGLGPLLAIATMMILGPLDAGPNTLALRFVVLADFIYALTIAALILQRVARMVAARRARSAGSRLHLRLVVTFSLMALVPTVLIAVFAMITVNFGLEGWFSDRVQRVLGTSLAAAQAYEDEKRQTLAEDAMAMETYLSFAKMNEAFVADGELRTYLTEAQANVQRGLREAFIVDGTGALRLRGDRSYLFDFDPPGIKDMDRAKAGEVVIIQDWDQNEFRALMAIDGYLDRYLYVSREVDGSILRLLDDTKETVQLYQQLEGERGRLLFEFGLLYLGFAVILILAAIWLGLWFAERLSRPVGRLAAAAQQVGRGDLAVKVREENGDDEIAMLGRVFNQMTTQLQSQRDALLTQTAQVEARRRLFDSVLSSVTAGVLGLDANGRVDFANRAALGLLDLPAEALQHNPLAEVVPEFTPLFTSLTESGRAVAQEHLSLSRHGKAETLLVRVSRRQTGDGRLEGFVIAFDDVSDLVTAQRMAAWGDVARRIAHEIKNPLTPIQLSAERVKRKFSRMLDADEAGKLAELTDVIVRQTNDLRRIVDEFSKFARMPEPQRKTEDLAAILRDAVVLQESGLPDLTIEARIPEGRIHRDVDATMLGQALTNLIKNAAEAIETRMEKRPEIEDAPQVRVTLTEAEDHLQITIDDNGIGLPDNPAKLFEPYVTTREKGTGLGLPIVKKIIEEHGGTLMLVPAPAFGASGHVGARAILTLPNSLSPISNDVTHSHD